MNRWYKVAENVLCAVITYVCVNKKCIKERKRQYKAVIMCVHTGCREERERDRERTKWLLLICV